MPKFRVMKTFVRKEIWTIEAESGIAACEIARSDPQAGTPPDHPYSEECKVLYLEEENPSVPYFHPGAVIDMGDVIPDKRYWFTKDLRQECTPLFDVPTEEIVAVLRGEGVILKSNDCVVDGNAVRMTFPTRRTADNFLKRLNRYLADRAERSK